MEHYLNEKTVMKFYLEQIEADNIIFLQTKAELKLEIKELISQLVAEDKMNSKILIATKLWKKLFEASMTYLSPNKQGYDKIFQYFDSYVEFEELIFASDSFYRDHTLHCLWVYFLGEYIRRNQMFDPLFAEENETDRMTKIMAELMEQLEVFDRETLRSIKSACKLIDEMSKFDESVRCVAALTHDLGYPLKKIEKINKSIKKVLPYFAINNFDDFTFEYENIQQEFVNLFIDFISRDFKLSIAMQEDGQRILAPIIKVNDRTAITEIVQEKIKDITEEEREILKEEMKAKVEFVAPYRKKIAFYNDFENYQHGIMSAFLLSKNLRAFQDMDYDAYDNIILQDGVHQSRPRQIALQTILSTISSHTCDSYLIQNVGRETFLTFVDELEEFSRISRASQNREYVEEFCDTALSMEDGWLNIVFEFNNTNLDNLDPERAFKGRCKRFLTLFDVPKLSETLKIRVTVVGKLPTDENTYVLEIARKYADIQINGESKSIPKYLKSTQFYTKEEYTQM